MAGTRRGSRSGGGFSSNWNKARETTGSETPMDDPVPLNPGTYTMQLLSGEVVDAGDHRQVMFKWGVLDEGDSESVVCTEWERIDDAERLVWLQRKFAALGVDLEDANIETEDDLTNLIAELVKDGVCAKVRVLEKDGYTNMRTRKYVEVEESRLFDPEEILKKGTASDASANTNAKTEDAPPAGVEEEYDFKVGEPVRFTLGDGWKEGTILAFTDDDEAKIKVEGSKRAKTVSLGNCEPLNPQGSSDSDPSTDDNPNLDTSKGMSEANDSGSDPFKRTDFKVGDRILADFGEDGKLEGEVTSVPPDGPDIQFTPDDTKQPELLAAELVVSIFPKAETSSRRRRGVDSASSSESSPQTSGDDESWSEKDACRFMDGKKQHDGEVRSVDGQVAKVKVQGIRKLFSVPVDKLEDPQ